jgi:hypothetical protein
MTVNVDFTGIAQSVVGALLEGVKALSGQVADQSTDLLHQALAWFSLSGLNFLVGTPVALITAGADLFGPTALRPVLQDATDLAFLLAGISYIGHHWFGWPGLGESVGRIAVTIISIGSSFRLMDLSMALVGGLTSHLTTRPPTLPDLSTTPPLIAFGATLIWLVLAARLGVEGGKRVVWLAVLYRTMPVALLSNLHASSGWIAATWVRLWVGHLVGVIGVLVCFVTSIDIIGAVGLPGGYILSLAALLVATDLLRVLAPREGMGTAGLSVGIGPVRATL